MTDLVDLVTRSLGEEAADTFHERVVTQADALRAGLEAGAFENEDYAIGLEVEVYAINAEPEPLPEPDEEDEADEAAETEEDADSPGNGEGFAGDEAVDDLSAGGSGGAWDDSLEPAAETDEATDSEDDTAAGESADGSADSSDSGASLEGFDDPGVGVEAKTDETTVEERDSGATVETESDEEPPADEGREEPYMDPDEWEGRLTRLSESIFEGPATKELGLHNAEINTDPDQYGATGLEVQTTAIEMRLKKARESAEAENKTLVLDAMWTVPPEEGSLTYLSDVEEHDGVVVAANMRQAPRYVAIENDALRHAGGSIDLDVPGASHTFPSILFESLTTSIQPHLQVPSVGAFSAHYNAAIRTMGPLLALCSNSPFLPADLYNEVDDPYALLDETHHELRVAAFEQSVNTTENAKVRVPRDIEGPTDVVDRVVADDTFAPFLREWTTDDDREDFADDHWEFDHKRGTYWRWLRCVVGGDAVEGAGDERSLRIEYRPIPTQPTVKDVIGAQVLTAGLIRGLVDADHPLAELPWQEAERSFYSAAEEGLDADLSWVTADGMRTTDHEVIYDEVFEYARRGLELADLGERRIDEFLEPLERRLEMGLTPSGWKVERVRTHLDEGETLEDAITAMQRDYFELSEAEQSFADWPAP